MLFQECLRQVSEHRARILLQFPASFFFSSKAAFVQPLSVSNARYSSRALDASLFFPSCARTRTKLYQASLNLGSCLTAASKYLSDSTHCLFLKCSTP